MLGFNVIQLNDRYGTGRCVVSRHHVLPDAFWCGRAFSRATSSVHDYELFDLGMKPFGDGMSQEKMLQVLDESHLLFWCNYCNAAQEGTMLRAASAGLTFPTNPKVTSTYVLSYRMPSDFFSRCLRKLRTSLNVAWLVWTNGPTFLLCTLTLTFETNHVML